MYTIIIIVARNFLQRVLEKDPIKRFTVQEALNH